MLNSVTRLQMAENHKLDIKFYHRVGEVNPEVHSTLNTAMNWMGVKSQILC